MFGVARPRRPSVRHDDYQTPSMSDRTEQLLTEISETLRRQLANQERALAQQEQAVKFQGEAIARQRGALRRIWALVILVLALIAITYGISIMQWYSRR